MTIKRLEVRTLRNLSSITIHPSPRLNLVFGHNGSGKTSLLESIHHLCLARSFRSLRTSHVIQHGQSEMTVFAEIESNGQPPHRLGLKRTIDNKLIIRLDGKHLQSRAELARLRPLILLTPDSSQLITGSPRLRRHYLDWLMFHVEPQFHSVWSEYQQILRQRNSILRSRRESEIRHWDIGLVERGTRIDSMRRSLIPELIKEISSHLLNLMPGIELQVGYKQGWKHGIGLEQALHESMQVDIRHGVTSVGPQRSDLVLMTNNRPVAEVLSRGQIKMLVFAMHLAQMEVLSRVSGKNSLVLIDDLSAELDTNHRRQLLGLLYQRCHQVFLTATGPQQVDLSSWSESKLFHVEHGRIVEDVW